MKHLRQCSFCTRKVYKLAARGLCANCYYREKRNGTPAYQDRAAKPCGVEGCTSPVIAKGYCDRHYRRWKRDGDPLSPRAENWGHTAAHPLRYSFEYFCRVGIAPEWKRDFWKFVSDVGERQSPTHKLWRVRPNEPLGPDNFEWRAASVGLPTQDKEQKAAYARAHRTLYPERYRDAYIQRKFGISALDYDALLAAQNGVCAICFQQERTTDQRRGKEFSLAVDHCHKSKKVRGLLCSHCNRGLGFFQDSVERLQSAIAHLNGASKWTLVREPL